MQWCLVIHSCGLSTIFAFVESFETWWNLCSKTFSKIFIIGVQFPESNRFSFDGKNIIKDFHPFHPFNPLMTNFWQSCNNKAMTMFVDKIYEQTSVTGELQPCICEGYKLSSLEQMWKVHKINNRFLLCLKLSRVRMLLKMSNNVFVMLAISTCHRLVNSEKLFCLRVIICRFVADLHSISESLISWTDKLWLRYLWLFSHQSQIWT